MTQTVMVVQFLLRIWVDVVNCKSEDLPLFELVIQQELCLPARVQRVLYLLRSTNLNPSAGIFWAVEERWPAKQLMRWAVAKQSLLNLWKKCTEKSHLGANRIQVGSLFEVMSLSFRLLHLTDSSTWWKTNEKVELSTKLKSEGVSCFYTCIEGCSALPETNAPAACIISPKLGICRTQNILEYSVKCKYKVT